MSIYQKIREQIPKTRSYKNFEEIISENRTQISYNQIVGLKREWRAFYYLKERFAFWNFRISTSDEDHDGIDIVGIKMHNFQESTFQVGGIKLKNSSCDYFLQVTDKTIYMHLSKKMIK